MPHVGALVLVGDVVAGEEGDRGVVCVESGWVI
jgi:hypothetical protein